MPEKYPYQEEWEDFRFRFALPFLAIPLWIAAIVLSAIFGGSFQAIENFIGFNPMLGIFIVLGVFMFVTPIFSILYKCPACGKYFGMATSIDFLISKPYRAKKCKNCDMPKYYGSTFLAEKFGEREAKELSLKWEEGRPERDVLS